MDSTTWKEFLPTVLSQLEEPIPPDFKIAPEPCAARSKLTRPPSNFDLHLGETDQLRFVKWSPSLVEQGMKKLSTLHPDNTPASDPGAQFWNHNDVSPNVAALDLDIVTGEKEIQTLVDGRILRPLCSISSRILFFLNAGPPGYRDGYEYRDLRVQTGDQGPPIWDTVVKLSEEEHTAAAKQVIPVLINRIIFALELKSVSVAPSSFFFRLCSRAAANLFKPPKKFAHQTCKNGTNCPHYNIRNIHRSPDAPAFFENLTQLPDFNPTEDELTQLINEIRTMNDDQANQFGTVHIVDGDNKFISAQDPRAHVALAIMRSGARSLTKDTDGDLDDDPNAPNAQTQSTSLREHSPADSDDLQDEFDEHYICVLQKVDRHPPQIHSTDSI
jgi:hypothetical protein